MVMVIAISEIVNCCRCQLDSRASGEGLFMFQFESCTCLTRRAASKIVQNMRERGDYATYETRTDEGVFDRHCADQY